MSDSMPISLVESFNKMLAKVLSNRLRCDIRKVILKSQLAFVHSRQIFYGILIANEMVDDACRLKKELLLFKVDFEKRERGWGVEL